MKMSCFALILFAAYVVCMAQPAMALSEDDKSMNLPDGTLRFTDPDDKTPSAINLEGTDKATGNAVDPSSIRYDYDPASGSYIPHKN